MIRRATQADRNLIIGLLDADLPDHGVQWDVPVLMSAAEVPPPTWFTNPNSHIWIDDTLGLVCNVGVMPEMLRAVVVWLLPRGAPSRDLMRLMVATLADAMRGHAQAGGWRVSATFTGTADGGEQLTHFWQTKFPGASVTRLPNGEWEIAWVLRDAARQAVT